MDALVKYYHALVEYYQVFFLVSAVNAFFIAVSLIAGFETLLVINLAGLFVTLVLGLLFGILNGLEVHLLKEEL